MNELILPKLYQLNLHTLNDLSSKSIQNEVVKHLEGGDIIYLPNLNFALNDNENVIFLNKLLGNRKNISYNPNNNKIKGCSDEKSYELLSNMLHRYYENSLKLISTLLPDYYNNITIGKTSYRPIEAMHRQSPSIRKDDKLLHVDAFPSQPVADTRILRVFTNINPNNESRKWKIGAKFLDIAPNFIKHTRNMLPLESSILYALKITKSKRTIYDHLMLQIHNAMKYDNKWQQESPFKEYEFPSGATWMVYTDTVSHAVIKGQHALEQTFYPNIIDMQYPKLAPQYILSQLKNLSLNSMIN